MFMLAKYSAMHKLYISQGCEIPPAKCTSNKLVYLACEGKSPRRELMDRKRDTGMEGWERRDRGLERRQGS